MSTLDAKNSLAFEHFSAHSAFAVWIGHGYLVIAGHVVNALLMCKNYAKKAAGKEL